LNAKNRKKLKPAMPVIELYENKFYNLDNSDKNRGSTLNKLISNLKK